MWQPWHARENWDPRRSSLLKLKTKCAKWMLERSGKILEKDAINKQFRPFRMWPKNRQHGIHGCRDSWRLGNSKSAKNILRKHTTLHLKSYSIEYWLIYLGTANIAQHTTNIAQMETKRRWTPVSRRCFFCQASTTLTHQQPNSNHQGVTFRSHLRATS